MSIRIRPEVVRLTVRISFVCICSVLVVLTGCSGDTPTAPASIPTIPPRPTPAPDATQTPFAVTAPLDPIYIGYPVSIDPRGPPGAGGVTWDMTVWATGGLRGNIQRVDLSLRDRATGSLLGTGAALGPFTVISKWSPPNRSPLSENGRQDLGFGKALGFVGKPAILRADVTIQDLLGESWTASREMSWELFPAPVLHSPVGVTVQQNDPRSGCPFDSWSSGYGLLLELAWEPPPIPVPVDDYSVDIIDGVGNQLMHYAVNHTKETSLRFVKCYAYVRPGAERGARIAVNARSNTYHAVSAWAVGRFDFQSCREAGTPGCQ